MNISKFFSLNFDSIGKNNKINVNKFFSNPINFKGNLNSDVVELSKDKQTDDTSLVHEQKTNSIDAEEIKSRWEECQKMRSELAFLDDDKYSDDEKLRMLQEKGLLIKDSAYMSDPVLKSFLQYRIVKRVELNEHFYSVMADKTKRQCERFAQLRQTAPYCTVKDVEKNGIKKENFHLIPDLKKENIADENDRPLYVYDMSSSATEQFFSDVKNKKVLLYQGKTKPNIACQPKEYTTADGEKFVVADSVDVENEYNQRILNGSTAYRKTIEALPFERTKVVQDGRTIEYVDYSNPKNVEIFNSVQDFCTPTSKYFGEVEDERIIPSINLKKAGYGNVATLTRLVKEGKLDGEIRTIKGKEVAFVRFNENSYKILSALRDKMPNIKKGSELAKELGVSTNRIMEMIMNRELDTVDEAIVPFDITACFVDTSKEKNKETIERIQLEKELKAEILGKQRELRKQHRAEEKDATQRANAARMALVWTYMPKTKAIASSIAKKDGRIAKLLAKEDDENTTLSQQEKIALKSYRKQVWLAAGTTERMEAEQKAKEAFELYHSSGINALEVEQQEALKRYGFC